MITSTIISTIIGTVVNTIFTNISTPSVPAGALVDREGNPILDSNGNYIIVGH